MLGAVGLGDPARGEPQGQGERGGGANPEEDLSQGGAVVKAPGGTEGEEDKSGRRDDECIGAQGAHPLFGNFVGVVEGLGAVPAVPRRQAREAGSGWRLLARSQEGQDGQCHGGDDGQHVSSGIGEGEARAAADGGHGGGAEYHRQPAQPQNDVELEDLDVLQDDTRGGGSLQRERKGL